MSLAGDVIDYLSGLRIVGGDLDGQPMEVWPWQRRFCRGTFSRPGDSALSIARGAGKSGLVAGLASAVVDGEGPLHSTRAQVLCVAASHEQARILFTDCLGYLRGLGYDLDDRRRWRKLDSPNMSLLEFRPSEAHIRCLGANPATMHGLRPKLALLDEPSQWDAAKRERALAAVKTGLGKTPGSRAVMLGTRPAAAEHPFAKALAGEADYAQVHAARPTDPPYQLRTWRKANPSIDYLPSLLAKYREEARLARQDPAHAAAFGALRLNLGTEDTEAQVLIEASLWDELVGLGPESPDSARSGVWGVDLGGSAASSAVACFEPATGSLRALAAFPELPPLTERGLRDGVGRLYSDCARRGELLTVGEHAVSYPALLAEARARFGAPSMIAADRWKAADLLDAMSKSGLRGVPVDWRGQGYRDGGEDVRHFRRACLERRVRPVKNVFLASAVGAARTVTDTAANSKLAKGSEGGRRVRARDDAAAASILAVSLAERHPPRQSSGAYLGVV